MTTPTKKLQANIWKLYAITFIRWFILIVPVIVLFYKNEMGLTQGQIILVTVYFTAIILLTEIPSGYFADKFGRKTSIIASTLCYFPAILAYGFAQEFWHIILLETFLALGIVFKSGADSALMYDTHVELNKTDEYHKVEGRMQASFSVSEGIASILGGIIATYLTLRAPIYFQAAVAFFAIPIAFSLTETKKHEFEDPTANWQNIKSAAKFALIKNPNLRWLILLIGILDLGSFFMVWFIQPYWEQVGIPLIYFGILWAILQFNIAFWAIISHKFKEKSYPALLLSFVILQTLAYIYLGFFTSIIGVLVIFIYGAIRGTNKPMYINYLNKRTPSHMRATVLSVESMISNLTYSVFAPFLGYFADLYSAQTAFHISAGTIAILGFIYLLLFHRTNQEYTHTNHTSH